MIAWPADLTSSDRKYIHKIAESFRLHTKSVGVGEGRHICVYLNLPEVRSHILQLQLHMISATKHE